MIEDEGRGDARSEVPEDRDSSLRTWERIDDVCDRFEAKWLAQEGPEIESFLPGSENLERELTFRELLKLELDYRWRQSAAKFSIGEYLDRFPEYREIIEDEFQWVEKTRRGGSTHLVACEEERLAVAWFFDHWDRGRGWPIGSSSASQPGTRGAPPRFRDSLPAPDDRFFESRFLRRLRIWSQLKSHEGFSLRTGADAAGQPWEIVGRIDERSDTWLRSEAESLPREFGDYQLLRVAGHGGMGVVYEAMHHPTKRRVALKLVRRDRMEHRRREEVESALNRFAQEARVAAVIDHEHWVRVYDVGEIEGQPYYSMQFVDGPSLAAMVRQGPLEGERAARYLEPVARALAAAHRNRILHRDLKPHNILVRRDTDQALITDFGLAKLLDGGAGETCTGDAFGSPSYVSPEQAWDASRVDERSDIYGLGATLYQAITGRPPFQASSLGRVIEQVLHSEPIEPSELNPHVDQDLVTICLKCLAKEPQRRFATATELADELQRFIENRPILSRPISRWERTKRWVQRNPLPAKLGGGVIFLLVLLCVGAVLASWSGRNSLRTTEQALAQERQAKDELTEALIENVELVSGELLLSEERFQPLRQKLLRGASNRLDQFLSEPTRDNEDRSRVSRIWSSIADVEFRSGQLPEAQQAAEEALNVLSQFDRAWQEGDRRTFLELQLILAEIEFESCLGEQALARLQQMASSDEFALLPFPDQAKVQIRSDQLAIDIHLAWAELAPAEKLLEHMRQCLLDLPDDGTIDYVLLASNMHERASLIHRQQADLDRGLEEARLAVSLWNLPETDSLEELTAACRSIYQIDFPPADYFRQQLELNRVIWSDDNMLKRAHNLDGLFRVLSSNVPRIDADREYNFVLAAVAYARVHLGARHRDLAPPSSVELDSRVMDEIHKIQIKGADRSALIARAKLELAVAVLDRNDPDKHASFERLESTVNAIGARVGSSRDSELASYCVALELRQADQLSIDGEADKAKQLRRQAIRRIKRFIDEGHVSIVIAEQFCRLIANEQNLPGAFDDMKRSNPASNWKVEWIQALHELHPRSSLLRIQLAKSRIQHQISSQPGSEVLQSIKTNLNVMRDCVDHSPFLDFRVAFGNKLIDLGIVFGRAGQIATAQEWADEGCGVWESLCDTWPENSSLHVRRAVGEFLNGTLNLNAKQFEEAAEHFQISDRAFKRAYELEGFRRDWTTENVGQWLFAKMMIHRHSPQHSEGQLPEALVIYHAAVEFGFQEDYLASVHQGILEELSASFVSGESDRRLQMQVFEELLQIVKDPSRREELEAKIDIVRMQTLSTSLDEKRLAFGRDVTVTLRQIARLCWRRVRRFAHKVSADLWLIGLHFAVSTRGNHSWRVP